MSDATTAAELMNIPAPQRDVGWLRKSLQMAIEVEFATIPPYLCALWSITDTDQLVYKLIYEIVMEEMAHLGLACNLLTTIEGTPQLKPNAVPNYPCGLPGGLRPNLIVPLMGLTKNAIAKFMDIERPQHDFSGRLPDDDTPTIGKFYGAILDAFKSPLNQDAVKGKKQLTRTGFHVHGLMVFPVLSATDALKAVSQIIEEGEGTSTSPLDVTEGNPADLAHYFRFAEIYHGKTMRLNEQGVWVFDGADISLPAAAPMAEVPLGGYKPADVSADVNQQLVAFDQKFTEMVTALQAAWENGAPTQLGASVEAMLDMTDLATALMQIPRTSGGGNYGPCFRLV